MKVTVRTESGAPSVDGTGYTPVSIGGSVIIERIFAWPGLCSPLFDSLFTRDYPTILGLTCLSAVLVLAGMLAADLLYLVADPRLRRPGVRE